MRKFLITFIFTISATLLLTLAASGQKGEVNEKRVKFARGKTSVTFKGLIRDRLRTDSYKINARAGQTLSVVFTSARKDLDICFSFPSGGRDFCGERKFSLKLDESGDYELIIDGWRENIAYTVTISVK